MSSFFHDTLNNFVAHWGYLTVFVMLAIEGFGFFFVPGETALITASIYAGANASSRLDIWLILVVGFFGAITGDNFSFWVGHRFGFGLLRRHGHLIRLNERRLKYVQYLYLRYGIPIVFVGRFVMILRSWESFLAGANQMHWRRFFPTNACASVCWVFAWGYGAYSLGKNSNSLAWISIGIFIFIVVLLIIGGIYFRRHEEEYEDLADKALPGPLRAHSREDVKKNLNLAD